MTSKRNSRVFDDDIPRRNRGQSSAMASLDASRRTSRTSSIEDMYTAMAGSTTTKNDDEERKKPAMYEIGSFPKLFDLDTGSEKATTALPVDTESTKSAPSSVTSSSGASSAILTDSGRMANFGVVVPGVYRSSYPLIEHFDFCQSLGLRTVVTLVNKSDERGVNLGAFVQANGIRHVMFDMQGTKKEDIPHHTMQSILEIVHDKSSHPLLIHCNQGKHRTGCVVAAARKVAGWPIDTVLHEYRTFAEPKVRDCDVAYISALEVSSLQPSKAEFGGNSASFTASYRTMRRRVFFRLFAVTSITMLVFMCTSWQWKFA